jgi:hypothetical protein
VFHHFHIDRDPLAVSETKRNVIDLNHWHASSQANQNTFVMMEKTIIIGSHFLFPCPAHSFEKHAESNYILGHRQPKPGAN